MRHLRILLAVVFLMSSVAQAAPPSADYDPGPNPKTEMGKELVNLVASLPPYPVVSEMIQGRQKFRPAFGPALWRMNLKPNSVKILFIGQDATHIAEAAARTATAGFGGRAQDLANYFGVDSGAAFINTYTYTIKGQYGAFDTPYFYSGPRGELSVRQSHFVDNELWMMTHDASSPVASWRNALIDWIIRNNKESLRMIVLFGGSARDSAGAFIEAHGGQVGTKLDPQEFKKIKVPKFRMAFSGGNNEFPVMLNEEGVDLYSELVDRRLDYKKVADQKAAIDAIKENPRFAADRMQFIGGGNYGSGVFHPAQLGGYDLNQVQIAGQTTRSLKGLKLSDRSKIRQDVLFLEFPHPTALSMMSKEDASGRVAQALEKIKPYVEAGWKIQADRGFSNKFAAGEPYVYARASIPDLYYDFGAPASRKVPVSSASRMPKNPHVIVFGTRDRIKFSESEIEQLTNAEPASLPDAEEYYTGRPRTESSRWVYDPGPGQRYAKIMKDNLDLEKIFATKRGQSWDTNGIDAFYVKSHPDHQDFGHYRGSFEDPKVLILADPDGADDLITARALTGTRGQYLHGMMRDLGVDDDYLVLKTLPFAMDGASAADWNKALELTKAYRQKLWRRVLERNEPQMIITDGEHATAEFKKFLEENEDLAGDKEKWVVIKREGLANNSGIRKAQSKVRRVFGFRDASLSGEMANIPRSHLSFYTRMWEGTSGDRIAFASGEGRGLAFAVVAPKWAWEQEMKLDAESARAVQKVKSKILERTNTTYELKSALDCSTYFLDEAS